MLNNFFSGIINYYSPIYTIIFDKQGNPIYQNKIVEDNLNINNNLISDFGWDVINNYLDNNNGNNNGGVEIEKTLIDKDGHDVVFLVNIIFIDDYILCFCTDITKIKNYNKYMKYALSELEEAKRKAEMSDKLKSSFLANISHSIRTPLNSIVGYSKLISNKRNVNKKFIKIIEESSRVLINLIDNIIDLSKIEVNEIDIKSDKCVLRDIMEHMYKVHYDDINKEYVEFILDDKLTNVIIYTDEYRLKQIISNLISNAIKFTEKGYIKIGYKIEKKVTIFYIKDTGIGIEEKDHECIFERFTQLDHKNSKKYEGNGLGLSITKKLVELLGGKIWLKSELNKGSTFYFTIPSDYIQKISNQYDNINIYDKPKWKGKRILIIDDDNYGQKLISEILKRTQADYDIVKNGISAIKKVKEKRYDIVLSNLELSDITGCDLVKKIKEVKNIPIIAQSPFLISKDKDSIIYDGFDDFINKPVDTYTLIKKINRLIK